MSTINIWSDISSIGHKDPDDPDVYTVAWAVREGVEVLDVQLVEGGLLVFRIRVSPDVPRS